MPNLIREKTTQSMLMTLELLVVCAQTNQLILSAWKTCSLHIICRERKKWEKNAQTNDVTYHQSVLFLKTKFVCFPKFSTHLYVYMYVIISDHLVASVYVACLSSQPPPPPPFLFYSIFWGMDIVYVASVFLSPPPPPPPISFFEGWLLHSYLWFLLMYTSTPLSEIYLPIFSCGYCACVCCISTVIIVYINLGACMGVF